VRTFCGQGGSKCGRPHFLVQKKTSDFFEIYGVFVRTKGKQGEPVYPVYTFCGQEDGVAIFRDILLTFKVKGN